MAPRPAFDSLIFTCEHGGNQIPRHYAGVFQKHRDLLETHRGYDIGALAVAKTLAKHFKVPLVFSTVSRLVIDLNRSLHHPKVFSELTRKLGEDQRANIISQHYAPYRQEVYDLLSKRLARRHKVLHLSIHSFTPELSGHVRNAQIGLLYDPKRPLELRFAWAWEKELKSAQETYRVRRNYPYLGYSDGLQTHLRTVFSPRLYAGLELEMNQAITQSREGQRSMAKLMIQTLGNLSL
jgi:predicted N-formylglutamate amidohydrolase